MLSILLLKGVSDLVSTCVVLQKQESDAVLDSSHSLTSGGHCHVNLEILELLSSVMNMMILKYCQKG